MTTASPITSLQRQGETLRNLYAWLRRCHREDVRLRDILQNKIKQVSDENICPQCGAIVPAIQYECQQCGWEFSFSSFSL